MGDRHELKRGQRAALALAWAAVALLAAGAATPSAAQPELPDYEAACEGENPYLVTVCYPPSRLPSPGQGDDYPAVVLFRDTPGDEPHYRLASTGQVGSVWGLAYDGRAKAVYAAAYQKRQRPFGPGGPGAVYRIDMETSDVDLLLQLPGAGEDRHEGRANGSDWLAADWVGKSSFGDIDVDEAGETLYAMNLLDRSIHRFALPEGEPLGSFVHGAADLDWAEDARPFGLLVQDGRVYHGVVRSAESSQRRSELSGFVFSSAPDGSDMRLVSSFPLYASRGVMRVPAYARLSWNPWRVRRRDPDSRSPPYVNPMPMLSDLALDASGNLAIGLRDRHTDSAEAYYVSEATSYGVGDILYGLARDGAWLVPPESQHFADHSSASDETVLGGLAHLPNPDRIVATDLGELAPGQAFLQSGAVWFDAPSGGKMAREQICAVNSRIGPLVPLGRRPGARAALIPAHSEGSPLSTKGDLEVLCSEAPPAPPTPSPSPTSSPSATATPSPSASPTPSATPSPSPTPTPTPTSLPRPLYLPLALREACTPETQRIDVALVIDASSSMQERAADGRTKLQAAVAAVRVFLDALRLDAGDQAALVRFHADAALLQPLGADRAALDAALDELAVGRSTCIVCGLEAADEELAGPRRDPDNLPVLILLTDGRSNPRPVSEAVARARQAKARGLLIFAIGLGTDLEEDALRAIASGPGRYFHAPGAEALEGIYRQIAVAIPCPDDAFWPSWSSWPR